MSLYVIHMRFTRRKILLAAAALVYAGVRRGASGAFELELDGEIVPVHDDSGALEAFSRLSPDMPSDSLAYAVLADPNPESEAFHTAFGFVCEGRQKRTGYKNGWQGVSYWLLDLSDPAADPNAPPVPPSPLPAGQLEEVLAAARLGKGWRAIAGR